MPFYIRYKRRISGNSSKDALALLALRKKIINLIQFIKQSPNSFWTVSETIFPLGKGIHPLPKTIFSLGNKTMSLPKAIFPLGKKTILIP